MGIRKISNEYRGKNLIYYCSRTMKISPTMLAGLLAVTERTLSNWGNASSEGQSSCKITRLNALADIIRLAEKNGIKGKVILNLINEPIPEDKEQKTLLYYVVDDPQNKLLMTVAAQVINSFK